MKVCLILSAVLLIAPAVSGSPWGITAHVPSARDFEYMERLGVDWVRIDFNWSDIESRGKGLYRWELHDEAVEAALARGKKVFATIAYTPAWARAGARHSAPPVDFADWADFVYRCVGRYAGEISYWGMWNEPNLYEFWTGTLEEYVYGILIPGAEAVRAANPAAKVLGPELSDKNRLYALDFLDYVLRNAGDSVDIVTQHAYGQPGSIFHFLDEQVLPILLELAPGKELWLTETGARSDDRGEEYQAAAYRLICAGVAERGYIDRVFFYKLVDGAEPEKWGLLHDDYSKKQAFGAYRAEIRGEPYVGECFIAGAVFGPDSRETLRFRRYRQAALSGSCRGRFICSAYYAVSPRAARLIGGSRVLSSIARMHLGWISGIIRAAGV